MKSILTIFLFGFSITLIAQDTTVSKNNQIYWKRSGWRMNDQRISLKEIKSHIQQVPEAVPSLQKAVNNRRLAFLSVIPIIASTFLIREPAGTGIRSTRNTIYYATNTIFAGSLLFFGIKSSKHLKKAILIHNEKRAVTY